MSLTLPYIIVEEFGAKDYNGDLISGIFKNVKDALNLPVLNYQYGYLEEMNQTIKQWTENDSFVQKRLPAIWIPQPFIIDHFSTTAGGDWYGDTKIDILIFAPTEKDWKAKERVENVFKPILYPIYLQTLEEIKKSVVFDVPYLTLHSHTDFYYWDEMDKYLTEKVDCLKMSGVNLRIKNKQNCLPISNL